MEEATTTDWSTSCYALKDIFDNFTLPIPVMVDEGYMLNETESLASGQLITIQSQEDVTHFKGTSPDGKVISIPIKCPFKVKLLCEEDGARYKGIRALSLADPRPKYVEVISKGRRDGGLIKNGDRLKTLLFERGPNGPTYLHFRNQRGKHLRLPIDFGGEFAACAESDQEFSLIDLCGKELPLLVKFVDGSKKNSVSEKIGAVKLQECVSEALVFATTKFEGKTYATAFPLSFDIKVRPMASAQRNPGQSVDPSTEIIDLDSFRDYMSKEQVPGEGGYVYFAQCDVIDKATLSPVLENGENAMVASEDSPKAGQDSNGYEIPIQRNDPKRKSTGFLSKVKSKLRGSKSENPKGKQNRPEIVIVRENGALSDGGDSGIYEEIPGDTYVSMDIIDGVRRTLGATKTSAARKRSLTRVRSAASPPPLPENHPLERRHTFSAKLRGSKLAAIKSKPEQRLPINEKENFRKFYDSMKRSQLELLNSGVESVGEILKTVMLEKYKAKFVENQIDGKLLVDLDEAVFKDMGLTPFEARKLRKYVFGWRPESLSCRKKSQFDCDDLEAQNWTEAEVENHLIGLGMPDFARFCKGNQVNGDLLWDLVVDDEMITGLLKGKNCRLNVVKLKNYVTEGWRPKSNAKTGDTVGQGSSKSKRPGSEGASPMDKGATNSNYMSLKFDKSKETGSSSVYQTSATKRTGTRPGERHVGARSSTPNSSGSSVADSPRNATSTAVVKDSLRKGAASNEAKTRNRLQAKVTYPKNSPYGKATAKEKEALEKEEVKESSNIRVGDKGGKKEIDSMRGQKVEKIKMVKKPTTKASKGKQLKSSAVGDDPKGSKTGQKGATAVNGASVLTKERENGSIESLKQTRKRTISWFSRNSSKSSEKKKNEASARMKADSVDGAAKAKAEAARPKGAEKETIVAKPSGAKDKKSKAKGRKAGKEATKPTEVSIGADVKKKSLNDAGSPQSPSVRNLKQQYESQETTKFTQGAPLRRTGNNTSRNAIKRKDTAPAKRVESEAAQKPASSSVAQLRKKFDGK